MVKKIFGVTDTGEQIELPFKKFLILTDNESNLEIELLGKESQHPEKPDLVLHVQSGPLVKIESPDGSSSLPEGEFIFKATEGARYLSILPGGANLTCIKVIRREP